MKLSYALILSGILTAGLAGMTGCTIQAHPAEVDIGPAVPAGYVYYDDPYYYHGWYDGPYWVWRDHDGHYWHESREFHERREHEGRH
ncbi:MAG TPA: hypothetical protein VK797_10715 [Tepidisphaeraceae bacterium]|jgi:hypothetical protein|nr:hypothetical protein [Tepidisphaeraceae bacterium]